MNDVSFKRVLIALVGAMGLGFGLGMLACLTPSAAFFQRIGQGCVMVALLVLAMQGADWFIDRAARTFGLYRLFLEFMMERRRARRAPK